jgi:hypothetical protein
MSSKNARCDTARGCVRKGLRDSALRASCRSGRRRLSERAELQLAQDEQPEIRQDVTAMPRGGSLSLSDVRGPTFGIVHHKTEFGH